MFMYFINDITENINVDLDGLFSIDDCILFMLLYADDAVVFSKSPEGLQSILNDLDLYYRTWGFKDKYVKNQSNDIRKGPTHSLQFYLCNEKLENVNIFKYLGIHFFKNGNWNRTQKRIPKHAAYALHNLFSLFNQFELPTSEKCKLFDTLVGSILNYSAEVLGSHEAKYIELIHTKFCRCVLHVTKSTNLAGLYGKLGRVPFVINRKIRMISHWINLLSLEDISILKKIYTLLKMTQKITYPKMVATGHSK